MRIRFFALAALALLLGACTQDEAGFLPEGAEGTSIVFTATGLNPAATATAGTRAPVDGNWEGYHAKSFSAFSVTFASGNEKHFSFPE